MGIERGPQYMPPDDEYFSSVTPEEEARENQIIKNWWEDTLNGTKPSSLFSLRNELTENDLQIATDKGLEVARISTPGKYEDEPPREVVYIAQPKKFAELIPENTLQRFRDMGLGDRLDTVLPLLEGKTIAQAMVWLDQYPRTDDEYEVEKHNRQRPEIAALSGIGFGYAPCDVEYFVKVSYMGENDNLATINDPRWGHSLCPKHLKEHPS